VRETEVMRRYQITASQNGHRLFRNNVALGWVGKFVKRYENGSVLIGNARPLHAGLCVGSGDLVGWKSIEITADMVGQRMGQFWSAEIKVGNNTPTTEQNTWREAVLKAGGYAETVYGDKS